MNTETDMRLLTKQQLLQSFAIFGVGFFLVTMVLTAFVIVPRINAVFQSQHLEDHQAALALEAQLFTRFVDSQKTILQDLARFPSLANAAMLSDASNPALIDLFDNVVIGGEPGRIVLQDIAGTVLLQSTQSLQGLYNEGNAWVERVSNGDISYHFHLLSQEGGQLTFKISTPVIYNTNFIEGVLSAEITVSLDQLFIAQSFDEHIAFKLAQDHITVATDNSLIEIPHELSVKLENPNVVFTHISDKAVILAKERVLRNTILTVLLIGFAISFLPFAMVKPQK